MIIAELEKQIVYAKRTLSLQEKREALTAVRALCDVALQSEMPTKQTLQQVNTSVIPTMQQNTTVMQKSSTMNTQNQANKLIEADANGDSLFDF